MGNKISRGELSREILHRGVGRNSYMKFFLFVLLSLCQLNFACAYIPGEFSGGNFQLVSISEKKFHGRGDFRSDQKND
jgi:hypothetical protein